DPQAAEVVQMRFFVGIPSGFVIRHSDLAIEVCSIQQAGLRTGESGQRARFTEWFGVRETGARKRNKRALKDTRFKTRYRLIRAGHSHWLLHWLILLITGSIGKTAVCRR